MKYPSEFFIKSVAAIEAGMIRARREHFQGYGVPTGSLTTPEASDLDNERVSSFRPRGYHSRSAGRVEVDEVRDQALEGLRVVSTCAFELILIVGNRDTALWYERWIDDRSNFLLADTMAALRRREPRANPDDAPFFTARELQSAENELTVELARMVAQYKSVPAARVQEALQLSNAQIANTIERLERLKPILPHLSPAAFARINAARERCDALVGKAKLNTRS